MRVAFGSVATTDDHVTPDWHPERHARLVAVEAAVQDALLGELLVPVAPRLASDAELGLAHSRTYLHELAELAGFGGGELDPDTVVSTGSANTARLAAGLGLAAIETLRRGDAEAAFVAPRPPGHHANASRGSGFCLFNNVAVAALALAEQGERVAIVDWDVHHGNGTQAIFWNDPRVLYVSTHESPAYPGTGDSREVGGPSALGLTVNIPLPAGATGDVVRHALDDVAAECVDRFNPTWVLLSAGFDAHAADPLADLALSGADFAALTRQVAAYAPVPGRVVAFLEGGYDLAALQASVTATVRALAGLATTGSGPETSGGPGLSHVEQARRRRVDRLETMA